MRDRLKRVSKAIGGGLAAGAAAAVQAAIGGAPSGSEWLRAIGLAFAGAALVYWFPKNAPKPGA